MSPPLAHAFLALADDDALPDQRTLPRVVTAALAAVLLAVGTPLGFLVVKRPSGRRAELQGRALDDE